MMLDVQNLQILLNQEQLSTAVNDLFNDGAYMIINDQTFNIDEAIKKTSLNVKEFDLSTIEPLVEQVLTNIIQGQLGMSKEQSTQLASALAKYTQLSLTNKIIMRSTIKGPGTVTPEDVELWVNAPGKSKLKIDSSANDGDSINLSYDCYYTCF